MRDRPGYVNAAAGSAPAPVPGPSAISNAGGAAAGGVNNNSGPTTDYALNPYINNPTIPASTVNSANSKRKLNTITDGTSNTIMIGHAYVAVADYRLITPQATYRLPIFNGGVLANARPGVGDALTWLRDGAAITNNQWGSPMPDGGLMAMADGTVRIFPYGMNLQNFLTPTDGIAVTLP
jgi:hypothetical protein